MKRYNLDRQWFFNFGVAQGSFAKQAERIIVDLPHDFSIIQKVIQMHLQVLLTAFSQEAWQPMKKHCSSPRTGRRRKSSLSLKAYI